MALRGPRRTTLIARPERQQQARREALRPAGQAGPAADLFTQASSHLQCTAPLLHHHPLQKVTASKGNAAATAKPCWLGLDLLAWEMGLRPSRWL